MRKYAVPSSLYMSHHWALFVVFGESREIEYTWSERKPLLLEIFLEIPLGVLPGQATNADWLDL